MTREVIFNLIQVHRCEVPIIWGRVNERNIAAMATPMTMLSNGSTVSKTGQ